MRALTFTLIALALAAPAAAQTADRLPDGWAFGATVGRFTIEDVRLVSTSIHITRLSHNRITPEFTMGFFPQYFDEGGVWLTPDLGLAANVSLPKATLLVKGGVSGVFAFGQGGGGALPGVHVGTGLLIQVIPGLGLRLEALYHRYLFEFNPDYGVGAWTFGIGISSLPKR